MHYLIYEIKHDISNKIYIGAHKTTNIHDGYMGSGKYIIRAIEKHGVENFTKTILHECTSESEMYDLEYEIVDLGFIERSDTYNLMIGGTGGWTYINDNCGNQGERLNRNLSNDRRKLGGLNATMNPEQMSKMLTGLKKYYQTNDGWFKGGHHSEETKRKIGKANAIHQDGEKTANMVAFG